MWVSLEEKKRKDRANILKRRGVILDRVCADSDIGGDQTLGFSSREKGEEKRIELLSLVTCIGGVRSRVYMFSIFVHSGKKVLWRQD